jgi:hypothetical protein
LEGLGNGGITNASKNRLIAKKTVVADLKEVDEKIDAYLKAMKFADKEDKKERNLTHQEQITLYLVILPFPNLSKSRG